MPSSHIESSHLSRLGEAVPGARSSQEPGLRLLLCAWRPLSDPRLHGEGGLPGEHWRGNSGEDKGYVNPGRPCLQLHAGHRLVSPVLSTI